jgi:twinkle protein
MAHDVIELKQDIFVIAFEAHYTETATVLAGKIGGRKFHLPATVDNQWTAEEKNAALDAMESTENGTVHLYDARGEADWDTVEKRIEFMHANHGVKVFYIDNLTAFAAANPEKERTIIEGIMGKMAALTTRLGIIAHYVSHLATPEGKSHEEGGSVLVRHFKGARAIGFWTHTVIGLERNTIDEDEDSKRTVCVVLLKIRKNGSKAGTRVMLKMNKQNNLEESKHDFIRRPPQAAAAADSPF